MLKVAYFRTYPWGMQVFLFLVMAFVFVSVAGVVVFSVLSAEGLSAVDIQHINPASSRKAINAAILAQGLGSVVLYTGSAFTFAFLSHPRPAEYLGLRRPGRPVQLLLAVLVILGAMPVLSWIQELIGRIDFGPAVKAAQKQNDDIFKAFLQMPDMMAFVKVFVIMAIVPAIGEELFFRGIFLRFARQKARGMVIPVVFSAAVFAYAHSNVYGMLSIFLAGVLLAVIYNLTGSIWCSIFAHMLFNGSQIILQYLGNSNKAISAFTDSDTVSLSLAAGGFAVFSIAFYLLLKNKTPLPQNWADNFTKEELDQLKTEKLHGA